MNKSLILVTGNKGKAAEFSRLLGLEVVAQKLVLPEVQALDVRDVTRHKAQAAFDQIGQPVFVDDSGIEFTAWQGLPGALTSWFMDTVGNDGLLRMLDGFEDRRATVTTAIGYCDKNGVQVVSADVYGEISVQTKGDNGFGYDPIFIPEGFGKTFAEMTSEEKDKCSMRAMAAEKLSAIVRS